MIQNQIYSFLFTHGLFSETQLKKEGLGEYFRKNYLIKSYYKYNVGFIQCLIYTLT